MHYEEEHTLQLVLIHLLGIGKTKPEHAILNEDFIK